MGRRGETDADSGRVIRSSDGRGGLWRPVAVAALPPWRQHFRAVAGGGFLRQGDLGADDQRDGKSVVSGMCVSVRVAPGGSRILINRNELSLIVTFVYLLRPILYHEST